MNLARWISEQDLTEQFRQYFREGGDPSRLFELTPYQLFRLLFRAAPEAELEPLEKLRRDNEARAARGQGPLVPHWAAKSVPFVRRK